MSGALAAGKEATWPGVQGGELVFASWPAPIE